MGKRREIVHDRITSRGKLKEEEEKSEVSRLISFKRSVNLLLRISSTCIGLIF